MYMVYASDLVGHKAYLDTLGYHMDTTTILSPLALPVTYTVGKETCSRL